MTESVLWVGVYGEGTSFSVRIQRNATVDDLRKAIAKEYKEQLNRQVYPGTLTLYFACEKNEDGSWSDKWLRADLQLKSWLQTGRKDDDPYEEMVPSWNLNKRYIQDRNDLGEEVIHILVEVPQSVPVIPSFAPNSASLLSAEDYSSAWLAEFRNCRILPQALPRVDELASFLNSDLPVKINISQVNFNQMIEFSGSDLLVNKIFQVNNSQSCASLFSELHRVFHPLAPGKNENSFITFWDETIRTGLDFVLRHIATYERDSAKYSSTGLKRPDFIYLVNAVCVFRGEEKRPSLEVLQTPRDELVDKLVWIYGDAPYLLGYAAVGYEVELYAITEALTTIKLGYYNIEKPYGRLALLLAILQMSRLFQSIAELTPDRAKGEYWSLSRSNGVMVHIQGMYVLKVFGTAEKYHQAKCHALEVYTMMNDNQVPNRDMLKRCDDGKMTLILHPRGDQQKPNSMAELFRALSSVLECLVVLHSALWMHRDIRWDNVIKSREVDDLWFLIDFIDSARSPQPRYTGNHLSRYHHAPEIFNNDMHDTAVDIWAVGHLIEDTDLYCDGWRMSPDRCHFSDLLLNEDPNLRPTAADALKQLKMLEKDYLSKQKPKQSRPRYAKEKKLRNRLS